MPMDRQQHASEEPETTTFQRTRRGIALGALLGAAIGAVAGIVAGSAIDGWGSTAMWGWTVFGVIGGIGLGFFFGGMSSLDDPRHGDEPTPDPETRGDTNLPSDTRERRTGLPPQTPSGGA